MFEEITYEKLRLYLEIYAVQENAHIKYIAYIRYYSYKYILYIVYIIQTHTNPSENEWYLG